MISLDGNGPLYQQLSRGLRRSIRQQDYRRGARLPGSRELARQLKVSRNAVLAAYDQLLAEGYLVTRLKSGTFVSDKLPDDMLLAEQPGNTGIQPPAMTAQLSRNGLRASKAAREGRGLACFKRDLRFDFEYGVTRPDRETVQELERLHSKVINDDAFDYGDPAGDTLLRQQLAGHLQRHRAVTVSPEQIIITSGSQQALDICARVFLDPGDQVVLEEPAYQGARQAFEAVGADIIPAVVDQYGLNSASLNATADTAKLVYVTPSHQFPTGVVMPVGRRLELINWAVQTSTYIIEDDYDSEFRYDCRPLEAIASLSQAGPVIYLGTLAKSLFPSLRIGYMALPPQLVEPFGDMKWLIDRGNPVIYQRVMARFIESGGYERHLRRMNRRYAVNRQLLVDGLRDHLGDHVEISGSNAGTHVVVWSKQNQPGFIEQLISDCRKQHVGIYPIEPYYLEKPDRCGWLMGFSGLEQSAVTQGVMRLAECYRLLSRMLGRH